MLKTELIKRSPLRILEKSIHGGVGVGNIGIIASKRGVGKTACLVHIAIDKLFQNKHVIHLSFSSKTSHIMDWYEILFQEIAKKRELEKVREIHDSLIQNRVIMNFNQAGVRIEHILRSIQALISSGNFQAEVLVIDGYDFSISSIEDLAALRKFARDHGLTIWGTTDTDDTTDGSDANDDTGGATGGTFNERGVPAGIVPFIEEIEVLIYLHNQDKHIELSLIKDHDRYVDEDLHLKLEARTLLISEE
ncbi:MAG: hypothetical protein ACR2PY_02820 [Salinispira sp.]